MEYETKELENGELEAYLKFDTGKVVPLNSKEKLEFDDKIEDWVRLIDYLEMGEQIPRLFDGKEYMWVKL